MKDVEGSGLWDWSNVGESAGDVEGTADELDVLFDFGGCIASNMPLLTSSWMVSIAEVFPIKSVTPI